jgi:hypothetical protein
MSAFRGIMKNPTKSVLSGVRRKPLAACCAALFALAAPEAFAQSTWQLTTCADSGPGSLRDIVANSAVSGDTVDFSSLNLSNCPSSVISLTTGAITIAQNSLTLQGHAQAVTGYYNGTYENDRVFNHTGTGTLIVKNLLIEYNHFYPDGPAKGGCIYSAGNVILDHTELFRCTAKPLTSGANSAAKVSGGGIFTKGSLILKYADVTANVAKTQGSATGGGAYSVGAFSMSSSSISANYSVGQAGGIFGRHGGSMTGSTISGNIAEDGSGSLGAGGAIVDGTSSDTFQITNSTISGNSAPQAVVGGVVSEVATTVRNSTIAFNTAKFGRIAKTGGGFNYFAAGLHMETGINNSSPLTLQSTILSNNTYGATETDFSALAFAPYTISITSDHNLIRASSGQQRPPTVSTACPLLGPLKFGVDSGPTRTHALLSRSPAIDTGSNPQNLATDQNLNTRTVGSGTDIGAYEVQDGVIFNSNFEGCPVLF